MTSCEYASRVTGPDSIAGAGRPAQRVTAGDGGTGGAAMREILQMHGVSVCGTQFGRQLDHGLFEFRLREAGLLVRVFCHAYGNRAILLLGAYDKGRHPALRRQASEIKLARARLKEWNGRQGS